MANGRAIIKHKVEPVPLDQSAYLANPVTKIQITGEDNFMMLLQYLILDLKDFETEEEYLVWYTAVVLQLYKHNSTYRPAQGFGRVQALEAEHPLLYFRSQGEHPHCRLFDLFVKTSEDKRKNGLLPRNSAYQELLEERFDHKNVKILSTLDDRGFPEEKVSSYFGLFIAHSGAKMNNFRVYTEGLASISHNSLENKLRSVFKAVPKNIEALEEKAVIERIFKIKNLFSDLAETMSQKSTHDNLQRKMAAQRKKHIEKIQQAGAALNPDLINISNSSGSNSVYITLYPNFTDAKREIENYKEGVTQLLLSFFLALLNYHAHTQGLYIHTERRQSFGFLRPTLTDTGSLIFRLSLGLEPESYLKVIENSLRDLQLVLAHYNFREPTDKLLKQCFKEKHKPRGDKVTDKTGNLLLSRVNSERKQLLAATKARAFLVIGVPVAVSFGLYLEEFIIKGDTAEPATPQLAVAGKGNNKTTTMIFELLSNLVLQSLDFIKEFALLDKIQTREEIQFSRCLWHSLLKLYNNCTRAIYLLSHISQYEESHLYAKANLLIENILEYRISLAALQTVNNPENKSTIVTKWKNEERRYAALHTGVDFQNTHIYFTDSGQQANIASLLALNKEFDTTDFYLFPKSYFELKLFCKDIAWKPLKDKASAKVAFLDSSEISQFKIEDFGNLKGLVLDTTFHPNLKDEKLKELVQALHDKHIWVFLTSSALKHDQLGLDKYQAGKIITLAPLNKTLLEKDEYQPATLTDDVTATLISISNKALHPAIISYLSIVNDCLQEKGLVTSKSLMRNGLYALKINEKSEDILGNLSSMKGEEYDDNYEDLCLMMDSLSVSRYRNIQNSLLMQASPLQQRNQG